MFNMRTLHKFCCYGIVKIKSLPYFFEAIKTFASGGKE